MIFPLNSNCCDSWVNAIAMSLSAKDPHSTMALRCCAAEYLNTGRGLVMEWEFCDLFPIDPAEDPLMVVVCYGRMRS